MMDDSEKNSESERDGAKESDSVRKEPVDAEEGHEGDGLFKAWELPPVPDWARRPPPRDPGTLFD
ncbi:MAG: hypothetical protein IIA66_00995 [Planctomycetes bacterium]|nr:hypothetical protein [Planctomycetota bacterium]